MKSKTISIFMFMGCFALMACGGWRTSAEPSETIVSKAYNYEQVRGISVANGIVLLFARPTTRKRTGDRSGECGGCARNQKR